MKSATLSFFLLAASLSSPAAWTVALHDFSTDDYSYRSATAAANFSGLLQAKLTGVEGVEWVERSQLHAAEKELNLSIGGFFPPSAALRAGKFVKADLLVAGQFVAASQPGRALHLEIIDLEHADLLAEVSLPVSGPTNQPVTITAGDITAAEKCLRTALQQAQSRLLLVKNQRVLAPLFFANTSGSHRLDFFEDELQSALAAAAATRGDVRILQFPRAAAAAGEAGLIMAGLVEQDPTAWQKVADVYVWAQYEEQKTDGLAFEQTPVTFTLNLWDGSDEVQTVAETVKVSELPQLKERLVKRMLDATRSFKKKPFSETARRQAARQLLFRACDIQAIFQQDYHPASPFLLSAQGQQLMQYQIKLLTIAYFFAPESHIIQRWWLERRWFRLIHGWEFSTLPALPDLFWQRLEQIRSYAEFAASFGLITPKELEPDFAQAGRLLHLRPLTEDEMLVGDWTTALRAVGDAISGEEKLSGFPMDAPREVLQTWQDQIRDDFAHRLFVMYEQALHSNPPISVPNAHLLIAYGLAFDLKDKEMKAKFVEDLWPAYLASHDMPTSRREYSAEEFKVYFTRGVLAKVQKTFADVNRPQQAEALIAQFKQKVKIVADPSAAQGAEWAHARKLAAIEFLPPRLRPELKPVLFPEMPPVYGVVTLKFNDGMLWVSTRAGVNTMRNRFWEHLLGLHSGAAVWRLPDNNHAPELLSPRLGPHSKVTSFCVQSGKLWMTLGQDGVFGLDLGTLQNTRYGDKEGVLSREMFASAPAGDRLYFGGGEPNRGKLNLVELPGLLWKSQDLGGENNPQIVLLQPFGQHLLVNDRVLDTRSGAWRPVRNELLKTYPYPDSGPMPAPDFGVLAATIGSNVLWLGTTRGLVACNHETVVQRSWFSLPGGYLVDTKSGEAVATAPQSRLPGGVTALADDGDFLWVAVTTRFDPSLNGVEHEGRWTNGCYVLTLHPGSMFGNGGTQYGGWRNAYSVNERNYVLLLHKPTGKWVGYFPVTSRVTSFAVSAEKLWIGLEDIGYVALGDHQWEDREVFAPSPLLEVRKASLTSIPPAQWVSDDIPTAELTSKTQQALQLLK